MGDMPELGEDADTQIVKRADGSWLVDGLTPIDEFKEYFKIKSMPEQDSGEYETIGGFLMYLMGRIPAAADNMQWEQYRFEIVDMDGNRIDKVLLTRLP
jgi:putative hemolysin